jgi:hypothetical protein
MMLCQAVAEVLGDAELAANLSTCVPDNLLSRMLASRMDQSSVLEMMQAQGMRVVHIA